MVKKKRVVKKKETKVEQKVLKKPIPIQDKKHKKIKYWAIGGFILAMVAVLFEVLLLVFGPFEKNSSLYYVFLPITVLGNNVIYKMIPGCFSEYGICPESTLTYVTAIALVVVIAFYFLVGALIGSIVGICKKK